jgi:hypothetical protein
MTEVSFLMNANVAKNTLFILSNYAQKIRLAVAFPFLLILPYQTLVISLSVGKQPHKTK